MPRIDPTITDEAKRIYDDIKNRNERGRFVSDAIIEKHARQTGPDLQTRVEELEKKVQDIIDRMDGVIP